VGYTNAGKSSLLNALTDASVLTENRLFATLDPTTRCIDLTCGGEMLLTDTVGFIQRLPPRLVDAFRATLEEVLEADVLVHVVDAVAPAMRQQVQVVEQTLFHIGVSQRPVITALNKSDLDPQHDTADFPNAVLVSALTGSGLNELRSRLAEMVRVSTVNVTVCIPYSAGELVSLFHQRGTVLHEAHESRGTLIEGTLPPDLAPRYQAYRTDPDR
jgi:GTP-binding protein HflX